MAVVPIPQQTPIERASWNAPVNDGMGQAASAVGAPINTLTQANDIQGQIAKNNALTSQTGNAVQDVMDKQRKFQLSMLNGVLTLPEEQQAGALSKVVPMMNRMGPTQYSEDMTPATAKLITMANVPTEAIPQFQMMQSQAGLLNALRDKFAPAVQTQGNVPSANVAPNGNSLPPGTPMPTNGVINGAQPIPQGGGTPIDPDALNLMALVKPDTANAMTNIQKLQYESPQGQAAIAQGKRQGEQAAEAKKGAIESGEGYNQVEQTIEALKKLSDNPDLPQSLYGIPAKQQAWFSQNFGNQKTANAANTFNTINESQTINAIRDLAATGQIRMTRTLENIINKGYLIDPDASPEAKKEQANAIETELRNSMIAAQNVNAKMNGGQQQQYTSPLNPPLSNANNASSSTQSYNSPEAIGQAYQSGKITKEEAKQLLVNHGYH